MNWYRKAQEIVELDKMPDSWSDANTDNPDDKEYNRAVKYFNIGHGDYVEEYGFEPDYQLWIMIDGRIRKSEVFTIDPETGESKGGGTHSSIWGHDVEARSIKGRYEPQTGRLVLVRLDRFRDVPNVVLNKVREAFPEAKKIIVAKVKR